MSTINEPDVDDLLIELFDFECSLLNLDSNGHDIVSNQSTGYHTIIYLTFIYKI